jgi:uncharacterized protein YbaP (TraB family)
MSYLKTKLLRSATIASFSALALMGCTASTASEDAQPAATQAAKKLTIADVNKAIDAAIAKAKTTSGSGEPALWTLKDDDTTVYIFGSFHMLPDGVNWNTPRIQKAFSDAQKMYLEADASTDEGLAKIQALVMERGIFNDGKTLSDYLDEDERTIVDKAAMSLGASLAQIDMMKPWLASVQLVQMNFAKNSMSATNGVELTLVDAAKKTGMEIGYLETAETQILAISSDTLDIQSHTLVFSMGTLDKGTEQVETLADEWLDGDIAGIGELITDDGSFGSSVTYDKVFVKRNRSWVPQIEAMLDTPGTVFVAVGAGHLAGPDSVIKMLEANGHKVSGPH